jgi:hypothetical protein
MRGARPRKKNGQAKIIVIPSLVVPISETVVDRRGKIVCAVDHDGYPTIIDPKSLIDGFIMDIAISVKNALDINQAALFTAEYGEETHLPIYYKNGAQRVAHISPLPNQRAVIQVWAVNETRPREKRTWQEDTTAIHEAINLLPGILNPGSCTD